MTSSEWITHWFPACVKEDEYRLNGGKVICLAAKYIPWRCDCGADNKIATHDYPVIYDYIEGKIITIVFRRNKYRCSRRGTPNQCGNDPRTDKLSLLHHPKFPGISSRLHDEIFRRIKAGDLGDFADATGMNREQIAMIGETTWQEIAFAKRPRTRNTFREKLEEIRHG